MLFGADGIFYMHFNSLIILFRQWRALCNPLEVPLSENSVVTLLVNSRGWSSLRIVFSQTRNFTVIAFTGWMYCIEIFFILPWKTEFAVEFPLYWIYFLPIRIFEQLALARQHSFPWKKFHCIEYTFTFRIFEQLALALKKQSCPEFTGHCIEYIFFIIQHVLATCACLEKQSCSEIFHFIEIFLSFRIFGATCACPENKVCPEFTVLNIYFLSSEIFEQLALALENTSCPENFHCIEIFLSFRIFEQLALALKTEFALNSRCWIYIFYHSEFLNNMRLPWKQSLPWNFSRRWSAALPPRTPMILRLKLPGQYRNFFASLKLISACLFVNPASGLKLENLSELRMRRSCNGIVTSNDLDSIASCWSPNLWWCFTCF